VAFALEGSTGWRYMEEAGVRGPGGNVEPPENGPAHFLGSAA
jgi:hypothetical protein